MRISGNILWMFSLKHLALRSLNESGSPGAQWGPWGFLTVARLFFFSAKISVVCSEYSAARSVGGILHTAPYVFLGGE